MQFRVVAGLGAASVLAGCATVPKGEPERAYISIIEDTAGPNGCDFRAGHFRDNDARRSSVGMTRDIPPAIGSLRFTGTYSYATQKRLQRPVSGEVRCFMIVREISSFTGEPLSEFAFELRAVDADKVEIRPRHGVVRSSALWRTAAARVNVSVAFGLVDPQSTAGAPHLLDHKQADFAALSVGAASADASASLQPPVTLRWPESAPTLRAIAVVGERLSRRPEPSRRIMAHQVAVSSLHNGDWPSAR